MSPQVVEQLDPQPFRDWVDSRISPEVDGDDVKLGAEAATVTVQQIAYDLGIGERRLHRWRYENETLERTEVEEALHHADCALWEVYPDLVEEGHRERTHGYCTGCREDVPVDSALDCLFCGKRTWRRRSGFDQSAACKLTDDQLRHLHKLNQQGVTIRELGRRVWRAAGYSGYQSAENAIRRGFRRLQLPVAKPGVALRRCSANRSTRARPVRCGKPPMVGSDYCFQHDEERRADVLAMTAKAFEAWKQDDRRAAA